MYLIPVIWFAIVLIHGICRAFYDTGFERGKEQGDKQFLIFKKAGFGFNMIIPPGSERLAQEFKDSVDQEVPARDNTDILSNPLFRGMPW